ncbi:MAG: HD domain-containing protein [Lachnospiraceae bacterium]|nr:HD domain-containing protein [Lachnospiraceae bacterium]
MKQIDIEKKLRKELDKERYRHTMGVMYTAASLAMAHGGDVEKAMIAGLLHDCAKCIPNDKKMQLCIKNKIEITPYEQRSPFLLHAKLGAYLAREQYGIKDLEILHAIKVHTTGAPYMNLLDKIIYIADYIEPNRDKAPDLPNVRVAAFQDLNETMKIILEDTLEYLKEGKGELDPMTMKAYEYFTRSNQEEE